GHSWLVRVLARWALRCSAKWNGMPDRQAASRPAFALTDRQRNGGAENVVGIIATLGLDEPFSVAAVTLQCAVGLTLAKEVGISPRKRHCIKRPKSFSRPLRWRCCSRSSPRLANVARISTST